MKTNILPSLIIILIVIACTSEVSKEKRPLVNAINQKVDDIDANHRVDIIEDDFHMGDSIYKIRGYYMDGKILKLVGVLYSPDGERDDYFYFENEKPIFTGHIIIHKQIQEASEYKYYFGSNGEIQETLFWKDHYKKGKQFPHENFNEFTPDMDSLMKVESERLGFFMDKLNSEGFAVIAENENLGANTQK